MVVLQLGPYPPPQGGVQTNLVAIRDAVRRRYGPASAPVINLTRFRRADADGVFYPHSPWRVLRLLRSIPADVVHIHIGGQFTPRLLALCFVCTALPGRRTVLTFHSGGYPSWQKGRRRLRSLRSIVLRRFDAIVAVNDEIRALFLGLGVEPSRLQVLCPYAPVTVREELELPDNLARFAAAHHPLLTTVGLLEPEYDLELQIRTLGRIRGTHPHAGLVIIGSGSLESGLRSAIAEQPYREHILLCGDVPHPLTVRTLSMSDAFLRTTLYDGDSVSVREALQLGTPVIASDNGMRPAGVHLVPKQDPDALVRALGDVLQAPRAEPHTSVHDGATGGAAGAVDDMLDLYEHLLQRPSGAERRVPSVS